MLLKTVSIAGLLLSAIAVAAAAPPPPTPLLLPSVRPLPIALDPAFQFRKAKLYFLGPEDLTLYSGRPVDPNDQDDPDAVNPTSQTSGGGGGKNKHKSTGAVEQASLTFERQYRLYGAVTRLDQRQRYGNYFDFFWRVKRPATVSVRLEYRQEKLHSHVQAQEVSLGNVHGTLKTSFKVIGDDYADNGRVLAWRCLLVENGRVVAEKRSYLCSTNGRPRFVWHFGPTGDSGIVGADVYAFRRQQIPNSKHQRNTNNQGSSCAFGRRQTWEGGTGSAPTKILPVSCKSRASWFLNLGASLDVGGWCLVLIHAGTREAGRQTIRESRSVAPSRLHF